jgi:hypothetical protein
MIGGLRAAAAAKMMCASGMAGAIFETHARFVIIARRIKHWSNFSLIHFLDR